MKINIGISKIPQMGDRELERAVLEQIMPPEYNQRFYEPLSIYRFRPTETAIHERDVLERMWALGWRDSQQLIKDETDPTDIKIVHAVHFIKDIGNDGYLLSEEIVRDNRPRAVLEAALVSVLGHEQYLENPQKSASSTFWGTLEEKD